MGRWTLKATAAQLREELERTTIANETGRQESERAHRDQVGHLQQTITALRRELEECDGE